MGTAVAPDLLHEARRRVDVARGADRDEEVAAGELEGDAVHLEGHLVEPHHVGAHGAHRAAAAARRVEPQVAAPGHHRVAARAAGLEHLAVHVDDALVAGALVQVVDVLGHHQHRARVLALELGQGMVGGVGPGLDQVDPTGVVELVHEGRVAGEALGRRHLLEVVLGPQAVLVAEGAEPGLGRDAGAGEDHDVLEIACRHGREPFKRCPALLSPDRAGQGKRGESAQGRAMIKVLFVCLGNICRSPLAEGVFRKLVAGQ